MRLNDSATANTGRAHACSLMGAVDDSPNSLQIGIPAPLGYIMSVADIVAKKRAFPADVTTRCHNRLLRYSPKKTGL